MCARCVSLECTKDQSGPAKVLGATLPPWGGGLAGPSLGDFWNPTFELHMSDNAVGGWGQSPPTPGDGGHIQALLKGSTAASQNLASGKPTGLSPVVFRQG